jgi:L-fuconolactonase
MLRLDAHHHFWQYSPAQYRWINERMADLKRDFLPPDLKLLLDGQGLDGSIAVQARQDVEETHWLLDLAEKHEAIRGVVGWVPLCASDVGEHLAALSGRKKLVGVRHVVQDERDDEFMMRADFRKGIGALAAYGLVYDLLLYPRHLRVAADLVRDFPGQIFVLDHIAKPPIAFGKREPWATHLRALAAFPNVFCKLSGMVTEARWKRWQRADFEPYLDTVCEAFGAARLMIGSDWPVCTLSASYEETLGIVLDYVGKFSAGERDGILGNNCASAYGIAAQ